MVDNVLRLVKPVSGNIPDYFSNKNIFITGFTGFLGKFLTQKLLTECPDIGRIYILMRASRKKTVPQKLQYALSNPIFDHLRENSPSVFNKIVAIEGDLYQINMGISNECRKELIDNVHIIYHVAATIRFDMPLTDAILLNVRGTRDVCRLALDLKKCCAFLHVSTAYCHINNQIIEEKLYPSPVDWKEAIELAENLDKFQFSIMDKKYSAGFPNTYTFTKAIAEGLISDMCTAKIQTIILRPTIVSPASGGPIIGWTDNFNGPIGLSVAIGKGVLRTVFAYNNVNYDMISVDLVINYIIKATWMQQYLSPNEISVYNSSSFNYYTLSTYDLVNQGFESLESAPFNPIWHANAEITNSESMYFINTFFFHILPGFIIDFIFGVLRKPQFFVKLQRQVYIVTISLSHFLRNRWEFRNYKCLELDNYIVESDIKAFYKFTSFNITQYMASCSKYIMKHMLHEANTNEDFLKYNRKRKIFAILHFAIKYTAISMSFYYIMRSESIFHAIGKKIYG